MSLFLESSRYHKTPQVEARTQDGRTIQVVKLRLLPPTTGSPTVVKHDDRLDIMAHRRYSDATKFWHIADANTELEARDLVSEAGRTINVPET